MTCAIAAPAQETPQVTECYRMTSEDCYFMKLQLRPLPLGLIGECGSAQQRDTS